MVLSAQRLCRTTTQYASVAHARTDFACSKIWGSSLCAWQRATCDQMRLYFLAVTAGGSSVKYRRQYNYAFRDRILRTPPTTSKKRFVDEHARDRTVCHRPSVGDPVEFFLGCAIAACRCACE